MLKMDAKIVFSYSVQGILSSGFSWCVSRPSFRRILSHWLFWVRQSADLRRPSRAPAIQRDDSHDFHLVQVND